MEYKKSFLDGPNDLYTVIFTKNIKFPTLIFIHGGPGLNCGLLEYLIEYDNLFSALQYNLVLYDQRACGRSPPIPLEVTHADNVNDLLNLYYFLVSEMKMDIKGMIGHSYGAKILADCIWLHQLNVFPIFVGISDSLLTPRLKNILLDLAWLRTHDLEKYRYYFSQLNDRNLPKLWQLTEELALIVKQSENRYPAFWANVEWYEKAKDILLTLNLPINSQVFNSVRRGMYSNEESLKLNIKNMKVAYLWVNGLYDSIMNGESALVDQSEITAFFQSAHYPHIEENPRFCSLLNGVLANESTRDEFP